MVNQLVVCLGHSPNEGDVQDGVHNNVGEGSSIGL